MVKPSLKKLLLSDKARVDDLMVPERGKARWRISELEQFLAEEVDGEIENPLMAMIGANRENRVFASSAEVDDFISELRNE